MKCQRAQQKLMAYHDSELSGGKARRLEKHLESCEECRRMLERLRRADQHAGSAVGVKNPIGMPGMPPPDDSYWKSFTARVLDRVEEDAATRVPEKPGPKSVRNPFIMRMAPAFSIALVVVVAAGVLMKAGGPERLAEAPVSATKPATRDQVQAVGAGDESDGSTLKDGERADAVSQDEPTPVKPGRERTAVSGYRPGTGDDDAASEPRAKMAEPAEENREKKADTSPEPGKSEAEAFAEEEPAGEGAGTSADVPESEPDPPLPDAAGDQAGPPEDGVKAQEAQALETIEPGADAVPTSRNRDAMDADAVSASPGVDEELSITDEQVRDEQLRKDDVAPVEAPSAVERESLSAAVPGTAAGTGPPALPAPDNAGVSTPVEPGAERGDDGSGVRTLTSEEPADDGGRQDFDSGHSRYRSPADQLTHARSLAEVRKFWESEQVLKDLIAQDPPSAIQEEASLLLVEVLSSQNRVGEARQVLDDARTQFPASDKVQTYELEGE